MAIARNHPIFNWIRCKGMLFHDTLNKVRSDAEEYAKTNPTFSGITPATKTWGWNQLKKLAEDDYYAGQIEVRIKELDQRATNTKRQLDVNTQTWEEEINKCEMESERLKEILLASKKNSNFNRTRLN